MTATKARKPCRRCGGGGFVNSPLDRGRCWRCNRDTSEGRPAPVSPELAASVKAYSRTQAERRLAVIEAALADPTIVGTSAQRARAEATAAALRAELEEA